LDFEKITPLDDNQIQNFKNALENSDLNRFYSDLHAWWPSPGLITFRRDQLNLRKAWREPRLSFVQIQEIFAEITYRQINHWERCHLIEPSRETDKTGWRRFSYIDVAHLAVIIELRSYGVGIQSIKRDLDSLNGLVSQFLAYVDHAIMTRLLGGREEPFEDHLTDLELNLALCPSFEVGIVKFSGNHPPLIGPADVLIVHLSRLMTQAGAFLYIPISSYVRTAIKLTGAKLPPVEVGLPGMLAKGLAEVLWMIEYCGAERVTITSAKDGKLDVKCLRRKSGHFDPEELRAAVESGENLKFELFSNRGKITMMTVEEKSRIGL
jgi:DNA-binding transcriptional MerR regulator